MYLSLVRFSSKILLLAEIVNHPQLFEMPSAPCAFWSDFFVVFYLIGVEQWALCCAAAPAAARLLRVPVPTVTAWGWSWEGDSPAAFPAPSDPNCASPLPEHIGQFRAHLAEQKLTPLPVLCNYQGKTKNTPRTPHRCGPDDARCSGLPGPSGPPLQLAGIPSMAYIY